jgi:hypothetical protein
MFEGGATEILWVLITVLVGVFLWVGGVERLLKRSRKKSVCVNPFYIKYL